MESLLSSAFDQLLSYDPTSVRRGLRHIEGLLAHLCRPYDAAGASKRSNNKDKPSVVDTRVADDPAYREFLRLQDGFEWNIALRLISCMEKLLGQESNDLTTLLLLSSLDLLQGVLLIHAPSRRVFARDVNMTILLDLLEPQSSSPQIQSATVNTLVCALVEEWPNVRTFENLDGLASMCTLFKRKSTDKEVKLKILEFLFFYLVPESSSSSPLTTTAKNDEVAIRRSSSSGGSGSSSSNGNSRPGLVFRTTVEKQKMLGKYLSNVDNLVNELRQSQPFGNLMI
ncbi:cell division protein Cdc14 [Lipomyces japonicus]|uniref:cell division protein Cdc14 n=1 Tax=Lipomyces japonicus TaxID=56871 RepID=UPI0034CFC1D3